MMRVKKMLDKYNLPESSAGYAGSGLTTDMLMWEGFQPDTDADLQYRIYYRQKQMASILGLELSDFASLPALQKALREKIGNEEEVINRLAENYPGSIQWNWKNLQMDDRTVLRHIIRQLYQYEIMGNTKVLYQYGETQDDFLLLDGESTRGYERLIQEKGVQDTKTEVKEETTKLKPDEDSAIERDAPSQIIDWRTFDELSSGFNPTIGLQDVNALIRLKYENTSNAFSSNQFLSMMQRALLAIAQVVDDVIELFYPNLSPRTQYAQLHQRFPTILPSDQNDIDNNPEAVSSLIKQIEKQEENVGNAFSPEGRRKRYVRLSPRERWVIESEVNSESDHNNMVLVLRKRAYALYQHVLTIMTKLREVNLLQLLTPSLNPQLSFAGVVENAYFDSAQGFADSYSSKVQVAEDVSFTILVSDQHFYDVNLQVGHDITKENNAWYFECYIDDAYQINGVPLLKGLHYPIQDGDVVTIKSNMSYVRYMIQSSGDNLQLSVVESSDKIGLVPASMLYIPGEFEVKVQYTYDNSPETHSSGVLGNAKFLQDYFGNWYIYKDENEVVQEDVVDIWIVNPLVGTNILLETPISMIDGDEIHFVQGKGNITSIYKAAIPKEKQNELHLSYLSQSDGLRINGQDEVVFGEDTAFKTDEEFVIWVISSQLDANSEHVADYVKDNKNTQAAHPFLLTDMGRNLGKQFYELIRTSKSKNEDSITEYDAYFQSVYNAIFRKYLTENGRILSMKERSVYQHFITLVLKSLKTRHYYEMKKRKISNARKIIIPFSLQGIKSQDKEGETPFIVKPYVNKLMSKISYEDEQYSYNRVMTFPFVSSQTDVQKMHDRLILRANDSPSLHTSDSSIESDRSISLREKIIKLALRIENILYAFSYRFVFYLDRILIDILNIKINRRIVLFGTKYFDTVSANFTNKRIIKLFGEGELTKLDEATIAYGVSGVSRELRSLLQNNAISDEQLVESVSVTLPFVRNLFMFDSGVSEKYTVGKHTAMVLGQNRKYFSRKHAQLFSESEMRLLLLLHDIGSGLAYKYEHTRVNQHKYTIRIAKVILMGLGYSEEQTQKFLLLINQDILGEYFKGDINEEQAKNEIINLSYKLKIPIEDVLSVLQEYYISDASAYTKDAGGTSAVMDAVFVFDSSSVHLSSSYEGKYQRLFSLIQEEKKLFETYELDLERYGAIRTFLEESPDTVTNSKLIQIDSSNAMVFGGKVDLSQRDDRVTLDFRLEESYWREITRRLNEQGAEQDTLEFVSSSNDSKKAMGETYIIELDDGIKLHIMIEADGKKMLTMRGFVRVDLGTCETVEEVLSRINSAYTTITSYVSTKVSSASIFNGDEDWAIKLSDFKMADVMGETFTVSSGPGYIDYYDGEYANMLMKKKKFFFTHKLNNSSDLLTLIRTGGLLSTIQRWKRGSFISGLSSQSDIITGGGDYVFTRVQTFENSFSGSYSSLTLVYSPLLSGRRHSFSFNDDEFGSVMSNSVIKSPSKRFSLDKLFNAYISPSNETMFSDAIGNEWLSYIVTGSEEIRESAIAELKDNGIFGLNGRPIEEVIVVVESSEQLEDLYDKFIEQKRH
jgi:hypothetical protein